MEKFGNAEIGEFGVWISGLLNKFVRVVNLLFKFNISLQFTKPHVRHTGSGLELLYRLFWFKASLGN